MTDTIDTPTDTILLYTNVSVLACAQKDVLRDDLDTRLVKTIVNTERSASAAGERQESIGEGFLKTVPDVQLSGRWVKEHVPGKGENVMHTEKYIQWLSGFVVAIIALLVLAGFIRLSIFNTEYLLLILAMALAGLFLYFRLH